MVVNSLDEVMVAVIPLETHGSKSSSRISYELDKDHIHVVSLVCLVSERQVFDLLFLSTELIAFSYEGSYPATKLWQ